jgi:hypothetical protein
MKLKLLTAIVAVAATLGFESMAFAQISFQISNQQSESLGQVTVTAASGGYYVNVDGNSTDTVNISDTVPVASVTIYGQVVPQGQNAIVTLPDQTIVAVMWQSPNAVIVLDKDEIE